MKKLILIIILLLTMAISANAQQADFPKLTGPYLGQKPPGTTPEIFAPGIVSTGLYTRDIAMSKDGNEIYFCVSDAATTAIFVTKMIDNRWTEPAIAPFSGTDYFDFEPHISPDGNRLYFLSSRPPYGQEPKDGWYYQNIWMVMRTENGWSKPELVDEPISTEANEFFPSMTNDNVLYFTRSTKEGLTRIYKSKFENSKFGDPEIIQLRISEKGMLFNAFISPKEDFLITCAINIDSTNVDQDYYISFKTRDGGWSDLVKFGPEINTSGDNANSAYVSPDGKYLFFNSSRKDSTKPKIKGGTTLRSILKSKSEPGYGSSAIYWISSEIIEELRPKE